jgi:hypothetical protein
VTEIKETYFALSLPGRWRVEATPKDKGLFIYTSENSQQVTVSIFPATPRLVAAELEAKLRAFLDIRRSAEKKEDPSAKLLESIVSKQDRAMTAFYQGRSPSGRALANFTIVNSTGIANIYYEAWLSPEAFAESARQIFREVTFVE